MNKRKPAFKFTCLFFFLFVNLYDSSGQSGFLESSFIGTGRVYTTTAEPTGFMMGFTNAIQQDGKLLVAGNRRAAFTQYEFNCVVLRYNENGSLDSNFGQGGIVACDFSANSNERERFLAITVQQDGKIIAVGFTGEGIDANSKGFLARFKTNGDLDSSFGLNGKIISNFCALEIKILNDGKIMTLGSGFIAKYNSNGTLDSTFGNNGIVITRITGRYKSVARDFDFQDDGKIVSAGYRVDTTNHSFTDFEVTRYHSNGQLDLSFNGVGYINTNIGTWEELANCIKVQPDGKILVAGTVEKRNSGSYSSRTSDIVIVRYLNNGTIDSSFGTNGKITYDLGYHNWPSKIELQSDGNILLSSTASGYYISNDGPFTLARFLPHGNLDSTFGIKGINSFKSNPYGETGNISMVLKNSRVYLSGFAHYSNNGPSLGFYTLAVQNDGIPLFPNSVDVCPGVAYINFTSDLPGSTYQWQLSTDSVVFNDINNNSEYNGVNSPNLTINNIPSSWYGYQYRCKVDNGVSNLFTIRISNVWTGSVSTAWENPANWSCGAVPDVYTDVTINSGNIAINSNPVIRSLRINPGATLTVATGFALTITH